MRVDTATLMMAGGITTALGGAVLAGVWFTQRGATALLWWSLANILYAAGIMMLAVGLPDQNATLMLVGSALSDAAPPLVWIGVRIFSHRPPPAALMIGAVVGWLVLDGVAGAITGTPGASFAGWAFWMLLSAFELCRGRTEKIMARRPLAAIFGVHALIYAGGAYEVLTGAFPVKGMSSLNSWFGAIYFEGIVYAMCSAVLMVLLYKERDTARYAHEAGSDSLTGIANRRSFLESAERLLMRCQQSAAPCSLIMFDLDRFKSINDSFGHPVGDRVLRAFSETVRGVLRPNDFFGRYGGEEFAVILPNATVETAFVIAERVRHAFADAQHFIDGKPLNATVSGGVAEAARQADIHAVIGAADRALYRAKSVGRNRIQRADGPDDRPHDNVIRVA